MAWTPGQPSSLLGPFTQCSAGIKTGSPYPCLGCLVSFGIFIFASWCPTGRSIILVSCTCRGAMTSPWREPLWCILLLQLGGWACGRWPCLEGRVSGIFKKLEISFGNSSRAVCIHEEPPTKFSGFDLHICGVAMRFHVIKGFCRKYKGILETKRFPL